jgi:flagellar biosynthetic protein FlhB
MIANILQVGFMVTGKSVQPKFSKISPLNGLKQLFGMRGLVRFIMSVGKVAVVLLVAWWSIYSDLPRIMTLIQLEAGPLLAAASALVWSLALKIALALLILGVLDYAYQKWQHEQDLKMTKQEVKEEHKRMEGDPLVKQRRSKVAKQLAMQRLQHDVPESDVVVTNPTHYAVALKYDGEAMNAPKVMAKGADHLAIRIRQLAAGHGVPLVERPPLARGMYQTVEIGDEIPPQFYNAVAEIMAYVYRLSEGRSA